MASERPLRAVRASDKPKRPQRAKSVTQAAESGSERELLVSMRVIVAKAVDSQNTSTRDLAALTRRLLEIDRDIRAIDLRAQQEADDVAAKVEDGDFDASAV